MDRFQHLFADTPLWLSRSRLVQGLCFFCRLVPLFFSAVSFSFWRSCYLRSKAYRYVLFVSLRRGSVLSLERAPATRGAVGCLLPVCLGLYPEIVAFVLCGGSGDFFTS